LDEKHSQDHHFNAATFTGETNSYKQLSINSKGDKFASQTCQFPGADYVTVYFAFASYISSDHVLKVYGDKSYSMEIGSFSGAFGHCSRNLASFDEIFKKTDTFISI
jgi:hypothetical protein